MNVPEGATDVLGRRIGAALLDVLALVVLLIGVGVLIGQGHASGGSASVQLHGASVAVWALLALAYYYIPEAQSGQTPGKDLMRVRVTRIDGHKPAPVAIAVRTVLRIVDVLPAFYLLGLVVVLCSGRRRQRIGALAAGTTVWRAQQSVALPQERGGVESVTPIRARAELQSAVQDLAARPRPTEL
jgi:uncharacterized RDD family membrane protein YckC